jgi:protease I
MSAKKILFLVGDSPKTTSNGAVIRGRRVSGYSACAPEVRLAGAEFVDTEPDRAIRDGNLVSGLAWSAHPQFLALFLDVLGTRISL